MDPRLKSALQVQAIVRRHDQLAIPVFVRRKGDATAGTILIKHNRRDLGCTVLNQARGSAGEPLWMRGTGAGLVDEPTADAYIARQAGRDPDLWVIEIEQRDGDIQLDEMIV